MRKILVLIFLFAALCPLSAFAQTPDDFFNGNALQEVRVYMNPHDWDSLRAHFLDDTYYAAEFHWIFNGRDIVSPQVAIRSRGLGSRSPIKPSLKVEFSRYESQYRFAGLQNLVLRGNTQDASMMHERVAMALFRRMGIAAPREAHARLYINDAYIGLYTLVEQIDPVFLADRLGQSGGYLYNYSYVDVFWFEDRGPDPKTYSPAPFKPENHFIDPEREPIASMIEVINQTTDAEFQNMIGQYVDVYSFIREIAAELFVAEQDGIVGAYGLNNFYLYRYQDSLASTFLPWDKSNAFWAIDWPINFAVDVNHLSHRLLAIPANLQLFQDTLRAAADAAGGPGGWLEQEIEKDYAQIQQAAYDDVNKLCDPGATGALRPCANEQFDNEVAYMIQFAQQRGNNVLGQLAGSK